jgi:ferric-dicitrate binding protein FerR (iron transport regulator)
MLPQQTIPALITDLNQAPPPPTKKRRSRQLAWLLLFILLTTGMFYGLPHLTRSVIPATNGNTQFSTELGSRRQLLLPDGTKVWLNAGSRLSYDSDMLRKDIRAVTLSGEAFFDVAKDKDRCFVIHTDKIAIRVLGTAFNVKAYPRDKITETTLMRGSVELTVNNKPYQKIVLKPKEKFALIDDGQPDPSSDPGVDPDPASAKSGRPAAPHTSNKEKLVIQDVVPVEVDDKEYVKEVSWVEDNLVFQNETLEELAPKMERWFNVQIELDNARIRSLHFTGIFHKETVEQAFAALQFIQPFKFKITDNHVYIH